MLAFKYDIYDPNNKLSSKEIGLPGTNTHAGDIKYNTFGAGYIYFADAHLKFLIWYDVIRNETTQLNGYTSDIKDNIFTLRVQFRF